MWNTIEYTTIGRGHLMTGVPCQDKVKTYCDKDVTVIALADGAGSSRLSHFGAERILDGITRELALRFEAYYHQDISVNKTCLADCIKATLDAAQHEYDCELKDLSSTLLAVALSGSKYFVAHIGDGVVGCQKNDELHTISKPDNGSFANETYFTTSASVISRMRIQKGDDKSLFGFVLMSDGTAASLYNKQSDALSPGIKRMMQMTALCSREALLQLFDSSFREAVTSFTQDDCSIALLVDADAYPAYSDLTINEKMDLLQIFPSSRNKARRLSQADMILEMTIPGCTASQIARQLYAKPFHIKKKLNRLMDIGLIVKNGSRYQNALYKVSNS